CGGRGTPTGQRLSANEQAFALAGAVELGRASVGAALNYYATTLAEASGGAASFSAGVRGRLSSKLVLGASVQYLGGQVDVGGFGAPLPRTVRAGAELRPLGPGHERVHLLLAADYAAVRGAPGRVGGARRRRAPFGGAARRSRRRPPGRPGTARSPRAPVWTTGDRARPPRSSPRHRTPRRAWSRNSSEPRPRWRVPAPRRPPARRPARSPRGA